MGCWSGGDLLVEAEVLFNCGDADFKLEAFVEIGCEVFLDDGEIARVVIEHLRVIGERGFHVGDVVLGRHLLAKIREIVLGGHVLDDMAEHFAEFLERRFLGHAFEVMSL
jgi:hypothetical protein